ncbi:hypothetical protein ACWKW6_16160 [Dyadobacter jiangsuensis]
MKTFFKSILSISLSILSQSCETKTGSAAPAWATSGRSVRIGIGASTREEQAPSGPFYGTKSVEVAFVLANIN